MTENKYILDPPYDPLVLFKKWFENAKKKELNDPNAMNLSTISANSKPSSRMVLLKDYNKKGFVFYSNKTSRKGMSLIRNPFVALNFHWKSIYRQIRIEGEVNEVSNKEADDYFDSRHEESKIGAWASNQSSELKDRKNLDDSIKYYKKKFEYRKIVRPSYWTGYRVDPNIIEFWQDMPYRLHDRLEYEKIGSKWVSKKLFP